MDFFTAGVVLCGIAATVVVVIYVGLLRGTAVGFWVLFISFALSIVYNIWSKTGHFLRIVAEISLAVSVGFLCLVGALSQHVSLTTQSVLFAFTLMLITLLVNSVPSGLKDIKADQESGAKSFVLSTGCFVIAGDRLYISAKLRIFALTLQLAIIVALVLTAMQFAIPLFIRFAMLLLLFVSALHLLKLLSLRSFYRLRHSGPLFSGFCNYFALFLVLFPSLSINLKVIVGLVVLLVILLSWLTKVTTQRKHHRRLVFRQTSFDK